MFFLCYNFKPFVRCNCPDLFSAVFDAASMMPALVHRLDGCCKQDRFGAICSGLAGHRVGMRGAD